jgi:hypothetical protein
MRRSDGISVCSAADDPTTLYGDAWAIEVAGLADPPLSLRDLLAAHGWYIANVVDASWVESSEWRPILEAAAGPRDEGLLEAAQALVDALPYEPGSMLGGKVALVRAALAAAGPRDVPTLPPPDPSLIDTLGEGADPDRPVRVLSDDYPTIEPRRYGKMG